MEPIPFKPDQRAELLRLGLPVSVIDFIEIDGLPLAQYRLTREPPHGDVLAELRAVGKAIDEARNGIERLLNATRAVPHLWSARMQIVGGGRRHVMDGIRLNASSTSLETARGVIDDAIARVPLEPVRHRAASHLPIEAIYDAVQLGLILAGREPVAPGLKPSVSPTSKFRRLIGICYEAIDAPTTDPERAIRAYIKKWRAFEKKREALNVGQNGLEDSDVLS